MSYWRRVLEDAPLVELPADPPSAAREGRGRGSVRGEALVGAPEDAIERVAVAAAIVLARYTRASDLVLGLARAGDEHVWPLRLQIRASDTAKDLVARVRDASIEAARHAPLPEEAPFRVAVATEGKDVGDVPVVVRACKDGRLTVEYDASRWDAITMQRVTKALLFVADEIARDGAQRASAIAVLRERDEREIVELGRGRTVRPPFVPIDVFVSRCAERWPDHPAVQHRRRVVSYGELVDRASRLATRLRREAPVRNSRVGVYLERSPELMIAELACWIAGHACVPFDAVTPPARVAQLLASCDAAFVLCSAATAENFDPPCPRAVFGEALDAELANEAKSVPADRHPHEVAYVIFTSGSTGKPKGVRVPHGSFSAFIQYDVRTMQLGPDDRITHMFSPGFDAAMEEIWRGLAAGSTVVIVDDDLRLSPAEFVRWLADERITQTGLAANLFEACAYEDWTKTKLRRLGTGVEKIPPLASKFPFQVAHGYGPTETTIGATETFDIRDVEGFAPIGRPFDDVNVYLLDDRMRLVPWGANGELFIGGAGVTLGYLEPEPTADRFLPDPFGAPGSRMYRTGDLARWRPDGLLQFQGRVDTQLKLRGHRIEPGEIEVAICGEPDVSAAAVIQASGPSGPRLVAFVVPKRGVTIDEAALVAELRSKLPPYMIPSAVHFLDALPQTTNSKTDRAALAALAARSIRTSGVAPRTPDEKAVAKIFAEVLGITQVGAVDDFFGLGGHSLLATKIVGAVRRDLAVDLPVRAVFEASTVEALAREIDRVRREGPGDDSEAEVEPPPIARGASETFASYAQEDVAGFERARPPSPILLLDTRLEIRGRVDVEAVRRAARAAIERHDALRTRVDVRGSRTKLSVAPADEVEIEIADVRTSGDPEAEATKIEEAARTPFPLAGEIPARVLVVRTGGDSAHVVLFTHHVLVDNGGLALFVRSFAAAYERAVQGKSASLEPPPVTYSEFAQWERTWFATGGARRLERVRKRLRDVAPIELPVDRPRSGALSLEAHEKYATLDRGELESLLAVAKAENVTPYMLFLVAVGALVRGHTGATRVPVGGPTDTRHRRPELAQLVGRFLNVFTCVVDVDRDPTVRELLRRVRPTALEALEYRDVPTFYAVGSESSFDCALHRIMLNGPTFWPKPEPILVRDAFTIDGKPLPVLDGERARNEIILSAWASDDELRLAARGASSLFDASRMQRLVDAFARILRACTPGARLSDLLALCD